MPAHLVRGAFRAGVPDRVQQVANFGHSVFGGDACWRVSTGDNVRRAPAHADRRGPGSSRVPRTRGWRPLPGAGRWPIRAASVFAGLRSLVISIEIAPERRILMSPHSFPLLKHDRDSQPRELKVRSATRGRELPVQVTRLGPDGRLKAEFANRDGSRREETKKRFPCSGFESMTRRQKLATRSRSPALSHRCFSA